MEYKIITVENKQDIQLPNEPFDLFGRMHVNRMAGEWSYEIELFSERETMVFPEENYDIEQIENNGFAIGAYHNNICIGIAIYEFSWNKYIFI